MISGGPRVEFEPYALPLRAPLRTAAGNISERRGWLVRLFEDNKVVGIGEAAPLRQAGTESLAEASAAIDQLSSTLALSARHLEPGAWEPFLLELLPALPAVRCGLDIALWDRAARRARLPLAALLNTNASQEVAVNALVTGQATADLATQDATNSSAQQLSDMLDSGFSVFKVKVGAGSLQEDCARIGTFRTFLAGRASIRLDANGAWASVDEALEALRELGLDRICSLEQPLPPGSEASWGPLQRLVPCLAADESVGNEASAARLLALGTVDALVLKPTRLGGLGPCLRIAQAARTAGIETWVTTMLESAVGRAACLHLAAALGSQSAHPHGLLTGSLLATDLTDSVEGPGPLCPIDQQRFGLGIPLPCVSSGSVHNTYRPPTSTKDPSQARLRSKDKILSVAQLNNQAQQLARSLEPGARLGILTGSAETTAVGLLATRAACGSAFLIDARLPDDLVDERITQVGAEFLLSEGQLRPIRDDSPPADSAQRGNRPVAPSAGLRVFTSGTSGRARMARLSWEALDCSAASVVKATGLGPGDCWYSPLPLAHVGGVGVLWRAICSGATAEFPGGFDPAALVARIRSGQVTHLSVVARMLERILQEAAGDFSGSALRWVLVGGGATPVSLVAQAREAGLPVATTYGLTEAGSTVSLHRPGSALSGPGDAGWVLPHIEVAVQATDAQGFGEISVRGKSLFAGYEGETKQEPLSWFATGDWGCLDNEGRLKLMNRRQDLIVSGGENIYPAELEHRLRALPEIKDVCVLGLPDATWGQQLVAVICLSKEQSEEPTGALESLTAWSAANLPPWERPRHWHLWPGSLPRTALGKLNRVELRTALRDQV